MASTNYNIDMTAWSIERPAMSGCMVKKYFGDRQSHDIQHRSVVKTTPDAVRGRNVIYSNGNFLDKHLLQ